MGAQAVVKDDDGFFATYAVSSWSPALIAPARWLGLGPDAVTGISAGVGLVAAVWFADGSRAGLVAGAVLFYLSFVLDCLDGQLSRYIGSSSAIGAWLDAISDRGKEILVYCGLAVGYGGAGDIWALAVAALCLLVIRHMIDFSYSDSRPAVPRQRPAPGRPKRVSPKHWAKKIIVLPIGERTALICVTAAVFNARVTFLALLGWGGVAALYMVAGRIRRSLK